MSSMFIILASDWGLAIISKPLWRLEDGFRQVSSYDTCNSGRKEGKERRKNARTNDEENDDKY